MQQFLFIYIIHLMKNYLTILSIDINGFHEYYIKNNASLVFVPCFLDQMHKHLLVYKMSLNYFQE